LTNVAGWSLAIAGVLFLTHYHAIGAEIRAKGTGHGTMTVSDNTNESLATSTGITAANPMAIGSIEPFGTGEPFGRKEVTWLGAAIDEAPEVLASQLGLDPGVGLVVTYVATNSPAAKAGLQKNDLLVEFDGQPLVHPLQLRKLVQVRKEGDTVKLMFYRAGKKQTVSATLAKNVTGFGLNDIPAGQGHGGAFRQFGDLPTGEAFREQMKALREQMGNIKIDQKQVQEEIRRSMEEARKTYREAMRQATNANSALGPILEDLARMGASVDNDASVTVRSTGRSAKSLVKADESGTIVMVRNPKLHLTAHDKDGKLLFDGEIETSDQCSQVPHELWNKVEPLLKKMAPEGEEKPVTKPVPPKEASSLHDDAAADVSRL
jgi:membrane-associated protease RseP (regulator of RpoE activity)